MPSRGLHLDREIIFVLTLSSIEINSPVLLVRAMLIAFNAMHMYAIASGEPIAASKAAPPAFRFYDQE